MVGEAVGVVGEQGFGLGPGLRAGSLLPGGYLLLGKTRASLYLVFSSVT